MNTFVSKTAVELLNIELNTALSLLCSVCAAEIKWQRQEAQHLSSVFKVQSTDVTAHMTFNPFIPLCQTLQEVNSLKQSLTDDCTSHSGSNFPNHPLVFRLFSSKQPQLSVHFKTNLLKDQETFHLISHFKRTEHRHYKIYSSRVRVCSFQIFQCENTCYMFSCTYIMCASWLSL